MSKICNTLGRLCNKKSVKCRSWKHDNDLTPMFPAAGGRFCCQWLYRAMNLQTLSSSFASPLRSPTTWTGLWGTWQTWRSRWQLWRRSTASSAPSRRTTTDLWVIDSDSVILLQVFDIWFSFSGTQRCRRWVCVWSYWVHLFMREQFYLLLRSQSFWDVPLPW